MTVDDVERLVERDRPDVVGLTVTSLSRCDALQVARAVRRTAPACLLVLGGVHPTVSTVEVLSDPWPGGSVVVRGEGEVAFGELLDCLGSGGSLSKVRGISFVQDGRVVENRPAPRVDDLDSLPPPARQLLPMDRYLELTGYTQVLASRGCPFKCAFCAVPAVWGRTCSFRDPRPVADEVRRLAEDYGFERVVFYDDAFAADRRRAVDLCRALVERAKGIEWWCMSRVDLVDPGLLSLMREAGCVQVFYGIESANQSTLDLVGKGITPRVAARAVKWTKGLGMKVTCSFIIGLPGEDRDMVLDTISFIKSLEPDVVDVTFLKPYPGTEIAERLEEFGLELVYDDPWTVLETKPVLLGAPVTRSEALGPDEMLELYSRALVDLGVSKRLRVKGEGP